MGQSDDLLQLQKEWREIVLTKLISLEKSQEEIKKDITDIKLSSVKDAEYKEKITSLEDRITILEEAKTRAITILVTFQVIGIIIWEVLSKIIK